MKKQRFFLPLAVILLMPMSAPTMEIRQELYSYRQAIPPVARMVTFIIDGSPASSHHAHFEGLLSVVHFDLNCSVFSTAEQTFLLNEILKKKIRRDTPLTIKGYTCFLGSEQYNQQLSRQRAEVIARFLRSHGFNIESVQGKGAQNPVTHTPKEFAANRRVEITRTR